MSIFRRRSRDKDFQDIEVSTKHVVPRIIAFCIAITIAIAGITIAVALWLRQPEGLHTVDAAADGGVPLYAADIKFVYYFTGGSNEIRAAKNAASAHYSAALLRACKLLDPQNEFAGFVNLATINKNPGQEYEVSGELYDVLKSAYGLTQERQGFNMFAGPLYRAWEDILVLNEPQEADPLFNEDQEALIAEFSAVLNDLSNFTLTFNDASRKVRFTYSEAVRKLLDDWDVTDGVIDTGILHDAYELKLVASFLIN